MSDALSFNMDHEGTKTRRKTGKGQGRMGKRWFFFNSFFLLPLLLCAFVPWWFPIFSSSLSAEEFPVIQLDSPAPITAIAFAPHGEQVVIAAQGSMEVRSWPQLKHRRKLTTKLPQVYDLAFSPDGKLLALVGGSPGDWGDVELHVWQAADAPVVRCPKKASDVFVAVAWRGNGEQLAIAGADKLGRVLDRNLHEVATVAGHSQPLTSAKWLESGEQFLTASLDQSIRLWDGASAKQLRSLDNHTAAVQDIALRPGQKEGVAPWIATCASDRTVRFWQPTIGRLIRFAKLPHPPLALAWSPDGAYVYAACTEAKVYRIDPESLEVQELPTKLPGWVYSIAVDPNGRSLLVGGERGQIQRLSLE